MNIKFLLDENMPYALIDLLEKRGFFVEHLKTMETVLEKYKDKLSKKHLIIVEDETLRIY
jgi:hypothetical protein